VEDGASDVIVVGSGAAGLCAALSARAHGARVTVLEKAATLGGTTAVSGGASWMPMNDHVGEVGVTDSREEALAYCVPLTAGRVEPHLVERYVDQGHRVARWLEANTPVRLSAQTNPDYRQEQEGAKVGGRMIEPQLFDSHRVPEPWRSRIRPPQFYGALRLEEVMRIYAPSLKPEKIPIDLVADRVAKGIVAAGQALVHMLVLGCVEAGVELRTGVPVRALTTARGRVTGVVIQDGRRTRRLAAPGGVILASGGFEWNRALQRRFLAGIITHPQSPPVTEGDGLVMAMEVGADLANMDEAWWGPASAIPGEEHEGRPLHRQVKERNAPHAICVNRYGQRFVNEAANYNDMAKALFHQDATAAGLRNQPAWVLFDQQYRERYSVLTCRTGDPDPEWLPAASSLAELAGKVGIDADGLEETVRRWNAMVREGRDRDYGKGESAFDRSQGDPDAPHPNLGTVERGPFYALALHLGCFGTKGGPRVDEHGRVQHVRDRPIDGLYAAGNVMAGVAGPAYWGGGNSIGAGLIWGFLSGAHAAGSPVPT
jgi:succinate dehydrogenase/fumarate reductase flavoprotein subunit